MAANNRDLKNKAYETIKERLLDCTYEPGTLLNEARLAEDLGFSRTPVREAISRLESDGFVKIMPKKGIYVSDILLSDVLQIFQTRIEIEPVALRMENFWKTSRISPTASVWTLPCIYLLLNTAEIVTLSI